MHFKRTAARNQDLNNQDLVYADFDNGTFELKHLNGLDLSDSEMEFIQMKRMRNKRHYNAPDPRLGDYEA